jgi:hypothetical protein
MPASVERCVKHLISQGKSEDSAWAICQSANKKKNKKGELYEEGDNLFLKTFLINDDINKIGWGVDESTLRQNIRNYIGKPLVVTEDFEHPDFGDTYEHVLQAQEKFRIGDIIDIQEKNGDYSAIIKITDPQAKVALQNGDLPSFVSPQIYHYEAEKEGAIATNWFATHIALVTDPAWGPHKARVSHKCMGDEGTCVAQLKAGSCNFCIKTTIDNYKDIVSNNKSGDFSSNINENDSKGRLADKTDENPTVKTYTEDEYKKLQLQLEKEQARSKVLEDTNNTLTEKDKTSTDRLTTLENTFRAKEVSNILNDVFYKTDEERNSAIDSFVKSGMNYEEINKIVAPLKVKSGSQNFESKIPAPTNKTKSGSVADEEEEESKEIPAWYTISTLSGYGGNL